MDGYWTVCPKPEGVFCSHTTEHMSIMQCISCRNVQACTSWFCFGFKGTGASLCGAGSRELVLLGAVCWHCYATSMTRPNVSMPLPAVGLTQRFSTAVHSAVWTCPQVTCQSHFIPPSSCHDNSAASRCGYQKRRWLQEDVTVLKSLYRRRACSRDKAWVELRKMTKTVDSLCWDFPLQEKGTCMAQSQQRNKGYWKWTYAEKESARHFKEGENLGGK